MDGAGDEPDSRPMRAFRITRRAFIGSVGAGAGAVAVGSPAWGEAPTVDGHDQRLTYEWITDGDSGARLLEIRLVTLEEPMRKDGETPEAFTTRKASEGDKEQHSEISWRVDPRAFGPDARILLFRSQTPGLRDRMVIRNVGYGRLTGRRITFVFERREIDVSPGSKRRRIVMEMETTVWSSQEGATRQKVFSLEAEGVRPRRWLRFRDFAAPERAEKALGTNAQKRPTRFAQTIRAIRVANTAKLMFNGLVTTAPGVENRLVEVIFDKSQSWTVEARDRLAAIGGQIPLEKLELFWALDSVNTAEEQADTAEQADKKKQTDTKEQTNKKEQAEAALFGRGTAKAAAANGLTLGGGGGPTLSFDNVNATDKDDKANKTNKDKSANKTDQDKNANKLLVLFRSGFADPDRAARMGAGAGQPQIIRAEAVLAGRWKGASFDGGGRIGKVGKLPGLDGSVLERIDARGPITEVGLAALSGSISFQARYAKDAKDKDAKEKADSPIGPLSLGRLADRDDGKSVMGEFPTRRGWPVTALWNWSTVRGQRQRPVADFIDAGVALIEAGIALPNATWSRLTFAETELRIHYTRDRLRVPPLGSHIDLGATDHVGLALLDLSRARLRASQSDQLLALSFRFSDLSLRFDRKDMTLVRSTPECALGVRPRSAWEEPTRQNRGAGFADQVPHDTRPVLVVEFPPQHLFEEASFRLGRGEMPDVMLNKVMEVDRKTGTVTFTDPKPTTTIYTITEDKIILDPDRRAHVVDALAVLAKGRTPEILRNVRVVLRREKARRLPESIKEDPSITEEKKKKNSAENARRKAFADFAIKVARMRWRTISAPAEQWIYIGPYAMDVDVVAKVRGLFDRGASARAGALMADMFAAVGQERDRMALSYPDSDLDGALKIDVQLQAVVPLYQQFRTFYRDKLLESFFRPDPNSPLAEIEARSAEPAEVEYIDFPDGHTMADRLRRARSTAVQNAFLADLQGAEKLEGPKRGRLANPSRLAFRVNCLDGLEAARAARRELLDGPEDADVRLPRQALAFDLNELLRFRGMELAVTARAEIPYEADAHGRIGGRALRLSDIAPGAMMARLGFTPGPDTGVALRLAEVAASLRAPTALETAIEMPARITLSPHQNAVVLTPQQPKDMAQVFDLVLPNTCRATTGPAADAVVRRLWAARFVTGQDGLDLDPGLRAVHSPDLRPGALLSRFAEGQRDAMPLTQPPGGAHDPWFLSGTQSEATPLTAAELKVLFPDRGDVCQQAADPAVRDLPGIVRDFCRRLLLSKAQRNLNFRNGLDARDRHQLVMLSSAWGLPISYARQGDTEATAQPEPEWQLWDVMPGNGLYAPRSLDVTELSLSALGGVLRHDTGFEPPIAPRFWRGRNPSRPIERAGVYDAFSVERWQQWINLGRDIFTEVVYKGFLLPIGIRASLVKVTEREFWIDPRTGAITAPLRQRMFIRVARPEKLFPAVRQPNAGRAFPVRRLELLTTVTPDIVDPYAEAAQNDPSEELPSGRLVLPNARGLVFWPRTLKARQGDIRFEMTLDGVRSDIPLIFADQTAIDDARTMAALVDYYAKLDSPVEGAPVDPINHRRTLQLRGAPMRYAPEIKAGSASFQTEHWTLQATAGATASLPSIPSSGDSGKLDTIAMQNEDYDFDPVRQANDQPPIYPAIASARLYLTQTERLIGRRLDAVDTVFDGAFMRDGLGSTESKNSAEVVLVLSKGVALKMDDKGDQSGGIFRPAGHVVGLSRQKGALTLDAAPEVPKSATGYVLPLLAQLFDDTEIRNARDSQPPASSGPVAAPRKPEGKELKKLREYYQSLLSSDAKICGLVSVKELIGLCTGLGDPTEDAPSLTEALEFGGAGEAGAEQIRNGIIVPLASAIRSVREEWAALEQRINGELAAGIGVVSGEPFNIGNVFPELEQSLTDLDAALSQAEGETDPVLFGFALGACYSAGMRFLGALERAASNPGQALDALASQMVVGLVGLLDILRGNFGSYLAALFGSFSDKLEGALNDAFLDVINKVINKAFAGAGGLMRRAFLAFPQPHLADATVPESWQQCLENFVPRADDAKAVLEAFAKHAVPRIALGEQLDPAMLVKNWLDDRQADPIKFSKFDMSLVDLRIKLEKGVEALRKLADDSIGKVAPDAEQEALREELGAAVDRLNKALAIFATDGGADEFIASGPPREQIGKRYIATVLVAMSSQHMAHCFTDLPLGFPAQILDFLSGLNWNADGGLPVIDIDLMGWFDPVAQALARLGRIKVAMNPFDLSILLREFDGLLGGVGMPLPDCGDFAGIWKVIQQAMTQLATLATKTDPVPSEWQQPLRAETLRGGKYNDPQKPWDGRLSVPRMLMQARAYLIQIHDDMANAQLTATQVRTAIAAVPGADAAGNALQAQLDLSNIRAVRARLDALQNIYETTFDAVMRDSEALRQTVDSLKRASQIEDACSGKDPAAALMALASLPRDVQTLVARREHMLQQLDKAVTATREQLEALRNVETLVPLFDTVAGHFDDIGLTNQGELTEWAKKAENDIRKLREALDKASLHVQGLAESLAKLLCEAFGLAQAALTEARGIQQNISDALSDEEIATLPPVVRPIGERLRRVWDAQQVENRLTQAGQHLNLVREIKDKLCDPNTPYQHLGELDASISAFAPKTGTPPLAAAREQMRGVEEALKDIVAELRLLLEKEPREVAEKLLLDIATTVVKKTVENVPGGNPLADKDKNLGIVSLYKRLKKVRDQAWKAAAEGPGAFKDKLQAQLTVPRGPYRPAPGGEEPPDDDRLATDVRMLAAIKPGNLTDEQRLFLHAFLREWATGQATPLLIGGNIADLVQDVFAGKLYRFIDFARLRKEFEGRLLALVPTRQKLDYTFKLPLGPEVNAATMGIFRPANGCKLEIGTSIQINLAAAVKDAPQDGSPLVSGSAVGALGAFDVKLVGDLFDALTLRFGAARFEAPIDGTPRFDITYLGHTIGPQLEFVKKLQSFLSPKDGSGAILRFHSGMPGVEAGYRLQLGDFAVGNLAFTNVGLEATAVLPFSDSAAVFKASLSSRAAPFTLTYAPYGGSGFFAILADVHGVIGFEASFEFGGSGVFAFGPLTGQGRLMSGVYIRQLTLNGMRLTEIAMTFFAGGSASIWIFNFTAALSVQMGMVNGNMSGRATFSFSFSMGLWDFKYSVSVSRSEGEGFSGDKRTAALG